MIKVGIVGGTGYTGIELIRLLHSHPEVELAAITSRSEAGRPLADLVPSFVSVAPLVFEEPSLHVLQGCDLVFFATPNGTAMRMTPELIDAGLRVIDLAADFRLQDPALWEKWYGEAHACTDLLAEAVYGLPELNRASIKQARLVANPGCYPTAVTLGFIPLIEQGIVDINHLIADVKSGVSGAGRAAQQAVLHAEVSESFKAYAIGGHRHLPEITQNLQFVSKSQPVGLTFVPHLVPMNRGIHATLYAQSLDENAQDLTELFMQRYKKEPFVSVLPAGSHPETRAVRGTNQCILSVNRVSKRQIVVLSVIDNLVKGAAGQAIQNMNIMYDFPEEMGLGSIGLLP
jgi:N-acetyl-gamma-glutamyl-phosphate reductase